MSDRDDAPGARRDERLVLRSTSSIWIVVALGALLVFLLGDAVVRGQPLVALRSLPWLALGGWVFFALLVRPCVIVTRDRLELVNIVRRHVIPWSAVDHLESRYQLRVFLTDGRRLRSWGAPSAGLDRAPRSQSRMGADGVTPLGARSRAALPPVDLAISRWREELLEREGRRPDDDATPATTVFEIPVLVITLALIAACAVSAAAVSQ